MKKTLVLAIIVACAFLGGCAIQAMQKTLPKEGVVYKGVRTRVSRAMVLYPVPLSDRNVYLKLTNRTKEKSFSKIKSLVSQYLKQRKFKIVKNPRYANLKVNIDVRFMTITTMADAHTFILRGYGGHILPAGTGALSYAEVKQTETDGNYAYTAVVDLLVDQRAKNITQSIHRQRKRANNIDWFDYWQRIVTTYPYQLFPPKFCKLQSAFNRSIALQIASVF